MEVKKSKRKLVKKKTSDFTCTGRLLQPRFRARCLAGNYAGNAVECRERKKIGREIQLQHIKRISFFIHSVFSRQVL